MDASYETQTDDDHVVEQLQPTETLIDRGVDDALDEGIIAPFDYSPAQGYGNTAAEMRQGETLNMRIKQEEPERRRSDPDEDADWNPLMERRQVGDQRAGRLVAHSGGYDAVDTEKEAVGEDVGFAGGAASAEEAAMHIITDEYFDVSDDPEGTDFEDNDAKGNDPQRNDARGNDAEADDAGRTVDAIPSKTDATAESTSQRTG